MSNKYTEQDSPLGKSTNYHNVYDPNILFPISRQLKRSEILADGNELPFTGFDLWNAYELSWLDPDGKPCVAVGQFKIDASSKNIVESKSVKLYLNSLNQHITNDKDSLKKILKNDLSNAVEGEVEINIFDVDDVNSLNIAKNTGDCIDYIPVKIRDYEYNPELLRVENEKIKEKVYSNLLKSNCLVTGQPDWASICIDYVGNKIDRSSLLEYIISFRMHNEFHEQCVERIFIDIESRCNPEELTVYANYTGRGGLDINPYRTNTKSGFSTIRTVRQ